MKNTRQNSDLFILLIGSGKWADNICRAFEHENISVYRISARDAVRRLESKTGPDYSEFITLIEKSLGTVICTQPSLQSRLIELGVNYFKNLILEKPLATTLLELAPYRNLIKSNHVVLVDHLDEVQSTTQKVLELELGRRPLFLYSRLTYPYQERKLFSPLLEYAPHLMSLTYFIFGEGLNYRISSNGAKKNGRLSGRQTSFTIEVFQDNKPIACLECGNAYPIKAREIVFSFESGEYISRDRIDVQLWYRDYSSLKENPVTFEYIPPLTKKVRDFLSCVSGNQLIRNEVANAIDLHKVLLQFEDIR